VQALRRAEAFAEEAATVARSTFGMRDPRTLGSLTTLAAVLADEGSLAEAEALDRQTLQMRRELLGPRDPATLLSMNNLAGELADQGRKAEAEALWREALQTQRQVLGIHNLNTLNTMGNLAYLLQTQDRLSEAEPLYREALQVQREMLGPHDHATIMTTNNLAGVIDGQGRLGEAEPLYREAYKRSQEASGPRNPMTLHVMNNLAELLEGQGQLYEAEVLLRLALRFRREELGPRHRSTLDTMSNLAMLLATENKPAEAEPMIREVLQLRQQTFGSRDPATLQSMNNLAFFLADQNRWKEAEPLARETLQSERDMLGSWNLQTVFGINNLAEILLYEGNLTGAEALSREAVHLTEVIVGENDPRLLPVQMNLIAILAAEGRVSDAATLQAQLEPHVFDWLGNELYSTKSAAARRHFVASQAGYQNLALNLALLPSGDAAATDLAGLAVLRFKNLAADEDARLAHLSHTSRDERVREAASRVRDLRARLALISRVGSRAEVAAVAEQLDTTQLALGKLSRTYGASLQARHANLNDVRVALASLPTQSALLEIRQFQPLDFRVDAKRPAHWAGVLISPTGETRVRDLGAVDASAPKVASLLADPTGDDGRLAAATLYQQLLAPFVADLHNVERLYIAPDGILYLVPFGLLHNVAASSLLQKMDVRLVQSGRDLLRPPPDKPARGLVAVGGIDFDMSRYKSNGLKSVVEPDAVDARVERSRSLTEAAFHTGFPALTESEQEVNDVADFYRVGRRDETVKVISGAVPTKSWLLSLPPPRVLHLATHGFYLQGQQAGDQPMLLAGIALAGANRQLRQDGQDGLLYALEAQDLDLEGTELVVLSACDTAKGQIDYGDGVSGLVRSLRTAGARYVLVTLRPVGDVSAGNFMRRFYFYWMTQGGSSDPAAALRQVQLETPGQSDQPMSSTDATWASFVLIGG
jgi:CHAT domain-containing protein/tetratricopeptide (TPR) repeat protein